MAESPTDTSVACEAPASSPRQPCLDQRRIRQRDRRGPVRRALRYRGAPALMAQVSATAMMTDAAAIAASASASSARRGRTTVRPCAAARAGAGVFRRCRPGNMFPASRPAGSLTSVPRGRYRRIFDRPRRQSRRGRSDRGPVPSSRRPLRECSSLAAPRPAVRSTPALRRIRRCCPAPGWSTEDGNAEVETTFQGHPAASGSSAKRFGTTTGVPQRRRGGGGLEAGRVRPCKPRSRRASAPPAKRAISQIFWETRSPSPLHASRRRRTEPPSSRAA